METIDVRTDNYDELQKARGLIRDINRLDTDSQLYRYIGNEEEADIALSKMYKLEQALQTLLNKYDIEKYLF